MKRFGFFIARFWALWLPLALVFVLPLTRPTGRIFSDPLVQTARSWRGAQADPNLMPAAARHPRDLDLQMWHLLQMPPNYDSQSEKNPRASAVARLQKRFPDEKILVAEPLLYDAGIWREQYWVFARTTAALTPAQLAAELKPLRAAAQRGAQMEPQNAFWWVSLARVEWRAGRHDAALGALERAAKCRFYDDFTRELAQRALRAQARYDSPLFEARRGLLRKAREYDSSRQIKTAQAWGQYAVRLRAQNSSARALRWSGALGAVGDLMQRDPNAIATLEAGAQWKKWAYRVGYPAGAKGMTQRGAAYFSAFATRNRRPDLARAVASQQARASEVERLTAFEGSYRRHETWLLPGQLGRRVEWAQVVSYGAVFCLIYLALWWTVSNLLLWRAGGAPSSRRDRWSLALAFAVPAIGLASAAVWGVIAVSSGPASLREMLWLSAMAFAFLSAPWVFASVCALATMRRQRARLALPPRIDMELALSPGARAFLRYFLPASVACSALLFFGGWALWLVAVWQKWSNIDLLTLLPPDRHGFTGSLLWDASGTPVPMFYGIFLCALCLAIWFGKWRWTTPRELRPITHGALRWWKESLGALMVVLAWCCLGAALVSAPLLRQANARLESALQKGELALARDLHADGAK